MLAPARVLVERTMPASHPTIPPQAASLLARAAGLLRAGRPAEAVAPPAAGRVPGAPGNAAILHDLGLACLECGRPHDAVRRCKPRSRLTRASPMRICALGIALEATGAVDAALMSYRRASVVRPSLADAHYRAGALLDDLGQAAPAVEAFRGPPRPRRKPRWGAWRRRARRWRVSARPMPRKPCGRRWRWTPAIQLRWSFWATSWPMPGISTKRAVCCSKQSRARRCAPGPITMSRAAARWGPAMRL